MTADPPDVELSGPDLHRILSLAPARSDFFSRLEARIAEAHRGGRLLGLVIVKIQNLRAVNTEFGYACGDRLLRQCAAAIRKALRPCDVAVRTGGAEFALILPALDSTGQAVLAANKVNRLIAEPVAVHDRHVKARSVAGIAIAPAHGTDAERLLRCAEDAVLAAVNSDDRLALYADGRAEKNPVPLCLEAELETAIAGGEITLHYQPKIDLRTRKVVGVESLARWTSPTQGPVRPDFFINLAEGAGLIADLTMLVLNIALREGHALQRGAGALSVAVNVSAATLNQLDMGELVERSLGIWGYDPNQLILEITESAMMADPEAALETLRRIRSAGVRISIDDFGTGYSSLAYLKQLPVNELKIDKSFVENMCEDPSDRKIVKAIVDLAHNFDLDVVAEGVENAAALEQLIAVGCEYAQGFHIARPMPANECLAWIAASAQVPARSVGPAATIGASSPLIACD